MNRASGVESNLTGTRTQFIGAPVGAGMTWVTPAIAAFCTAGFFLRLVFFTGPIGSDDVSYFHYAQRIVEGRSFHGLAALNFPHQGGRLAFLVAVGVPAAAFDSIHVGAFTNLLWYSARDVMLTLFAFRAIGAVPAAFAAAFLSLNPLSLVYASVMAPDGLTAFAMAASSLAAYQGLQSVGRRAPSWMLASGALAAIAYSTKETGILVVAPTGLAILYWCRGPLRIYALVAFGVGCAAVMGLEMLALWHLTGDPLFRIHAVSQVHNQGMGGGTGVVEFLRRIYWNLHNVTRPLTLSLPVLVLLIPVAAIAMFDRSRRLLFPATGLFLTLYLIFGSSSLTRLVPVPAADRYLEPIIPYLAVSLAMAVHILLAGTERARQAWALPAMIAFSAATAATAAPSVTYQAGDVTFSALCKNAALALSAAKHKYPHLEIYASPDLLYSLEPFIESASFRRLKPYPTSTPLPPGLYLMHPWRDFKVRASHEVYRDLESMPIETWIDVDQRVVSTLKLPPAWRKSFGEVRIRTQPISQAVIER